MNNFLIIFSLKCSLTYYSFWKVYFQPFNIIPGNKRTIVAALLLVLYAQIYNALDFPYFRVFRVLNKTSEERPLLLRNRLRGIFIVWTHTGYRHWRELGLRMTNNLKLLLRNLFYQTLSNSPTYIHCWK